MLHADKLAFEANLAQDLVAIQMKELEVYQLELERENAKLKRSLTFANEQLSTMKQYVDTYLPKYQKEIVRLKQKAKDTAKALGMRENA